VWRKIEPDQQPDSAVGGSFRFWRGGFAGFAPCFGGGPPCGLFFRFGRGGRFLYRCSFGGGFCRSAFRPVHFVLHSFVQPEGLSPSVEFVPCLLGLFLVGPKIEANIDSVRVSHSSSLRRSARQVKIRPFRAWQAHKNPLACHSEGGVCPRNLLFSKFLVRKQIPRFACCRRQARNDTGKLCRHPAATPDLSFEESFLSRLPSNHFWRIMKESLGFA
jgi:hypothetical protein